MAIRRRRIEKAVESILRTHGVSQPPVPIEEIARKVGLQIRVEALDSDLSGFLYLDTAQKLIGVNSHHARVRQRFTVAHELGHYLLHQGETIRLDRTVLAKLRSELSSQGVNPEEIEANLFAAEILMPRELLAADMAGGEAVDILDDITVQKLARRYYVSPQALLFRLVNLGYVE